MAIILHFVSSIRVCRSRRKDKGEANAELTSNVRMFETSLQITVMQLFIASMPICSSLLEHNTLHE